MFLNDHYPCPTVRFQPITTLEKEMHKSFTVAFARTYHWPKGSTDISLAQRKHGHSTGPKDGWTYHWPKGSTDTTLAQSKHGQSTGPKGPLAQRQHGTAQRKHGHNTGPKEAWTEYWPKGTTGPKAARHWSKGTAPAQRKHGQSTGPKEALAQRKHRHITGPEEVWTQHWPKESTDIALAQRSNVVEKLWGSKEDLVQTTNFINAIKLDVWGQSWNAEEKEEDHKATSDSAIAEIHVQHTCTVCLFTKPPTSLPEFLLNVACGCPCGGVIKMQSSCLMECICQCTIAYRRWPPECLVGGCHNNNCWDTYIAYWSQSHKQHSYCRNAYNIAYLFTKPLKCTDNLLDHKTTKSAEICT